MPLEGSIFYTYHSGGSSPPESPPLVLIHGAGGSHLHWPPELRRMPGEIVYSVDLPGHGQSGGNPEDSIGGYARKLMTWMDHLDLASTVLVGHSMGGAIAMTVALEDPERIRGLILVGSGARLRVNPQILALTGDKDLYRQATKLVTQWAFSEHADVRLMELAQKRMAEVPASVVHADFIACDHFDIMDRLLEILAPTLILCGAEDQLTPVKYSQYLAENMPHARLVVIETAGHMVMLEKPLEIVKHTHNFLQNIL
jgi:pimeloyl-ACP methyl ester carboxylesterase